MFITAVFLRSFMLRRSSEIPDSIVLTFQVPSFRVGLFVRIELAGETIITGFRLLT